MPHFILGKKEREQRPISPGCPCPLGQAVKYAKEMFSQASLIIRAQALVFQHRQLASCPITSLLLLRSDGMLQAKNFCHLSQERSGFDVGLSNNCSPRPRWDDASDASVIPTSVGRDEPFHYQDKPRLLRRASWQHKAEVDGQSPIHPPAGPPPSNS